MSCVLRIGGENFDVESFLEASQLPVFDKYYKGQPRTVSSRRVNEYSGVSISASDADFDNFNGQLTDTICFLTEYEEQLKVIAVTPGIEFAVIDFGINPTLNDDRLMQSFYFSSELVGVCAALGIEIKLTLYKEDLEAVLERKRLEKVGQKS